MHFTRPAVLFAALQLFTHVSGSPVAQVSSSATGRPTITVRIGTCLSSGSLKPNSGSGSTGGSGAGQTGTMKPSATQSAAYGSISGDNGFGQPTTTSSLAMTPSTSILGASSFNGAVTRSTSSGSTGSASSMTSMPLGSTATTASLGSSTTSSVSVTSSSITPSSIMSSAPTTSSTANTISTSPTSSSTTVSSTVDPLQPYLATPTTIITEPDASLYYQGDDATASVQLPFQMKLFSQTSSNIFVSTNGLLSFDTGSTSYANGPLPLSNLPSMTMAAYWEDLIAEGGTIEGVFYQVDNSGTSPSVTFEYILASLGIQDEYYHFLVSYQSNIPGVIKVYYFSTPDGGAGATIGIQGTQTTGQQAINYSNAGSPPIAPGQVVTFDTNLGTSSMSTFNVACYALGAWPTSSC